METIFEYNNVRKQKYLISLTTQKLNRILKKYPFVLKAHIFFKKENKDKEKGNICGIRISVPGPMIYASSNENSFTSSVHKTIKNLKTQLKKRKTITKHSCGRHDRA